MDTAEYCFNVERLARAGVRPHPPAVSTRSLSGGRGLQWGLMDPAGCACLWEMNGGPPQPTGRILLYVRRNQ